MSAASCQVYRKYKITARDGTNVTLTQVEEGHGETKLPATIVIAHGDNTTFWGGVGDGKFYVLGIDLHT